VTAAAPALLQDADRAMILAAAAQLRETAIKDKSYQETPIGHLVGRYLRQLTFDNYSARTIESRENILAHLALDLAHHHPADITHNDLLEHLNNRYAHVKPNTRKSSVSAVKCLFAWAHDNDHLPADPARKLRSPRHDDTERRAHSLATIRRLVVAADLRRDRVVLLLLYWCALRRNELRLIQFRDIDLARRVVLVHGKGGTHLEQNIPEQVALELERYMLDEAPRRDDYLLYPMKTGRRGKWPTYVTDVVWEDRSRPLSLSGVGNWWERMVRRAGLEHFPMHEMRHSAGTHFHEAGRDLVATQHFMRHKNPATTAGVYVHLDRGLTIARVQRAMADPMGGEE